MSSRRQMQSDCRINRVVKCNRVVKPIEQFIDQTISQSIRIVQFRLALGPLAPWSPYIFDMAVIFVLCFFLELPWHIWYGSYLVFFFLRCLGIFLWQLCSVFYFMELLVGPLGPWPLWPDALLISWSLGPSVPWSFGPLASWSRGSLVLLVHLVLEFLGPLATWYLFPLVLRSYGPLVPWSLGPLIPCPLALGPLAPRSIDIFDMALSVCSFFLKLPWHFFHGSNFPFFSSCLDFSSMAFFYCS